MANDWFLTKSVAEYLAQTKISLDREEKNADFWL